MMNNVHLEFQSEMRRAELLEAADQRRLVREAANEQPASTRTPLWKRIRTALTEAEAPTSYPAGELRRAE